MKKMVPVPFTRSFGGRDAPMPLDRSRPNSLERLLVQVLFFHLSISFLIDPCFPDVGEIALVLFCVETRLAASFLLTLSRECIKCALCAVNCARWA